MTSNWDRWMNSKRGFVLRALFGLSGSLLGLALIWVAWFGASFKRTNPEWDGEVTALLILGVAVILASLHAAVRPSVRNAVVAAVVIALVPVAGGIL